MEHVVIVGNGIAGTTVARHIRKKSDKKITMISAEWDNFFSRTALMYVYMGHMRFKDIEPYPRDFWKQNRISTIQAKVEEIDFDLKSLRLSNGENLVYDKLVLAVGSKPNKFGWKGEDLDGVQGLYSKQDLDLLEENTKGINKAVVVGGGLIGIELAEMLLTRNISVDILVRDKHFWGSVLPDVDAQFVEKHLRLHHNLNVICSEELDEIIPDEKGRVKAVKTKHAKELISCELVGLTTGVKPNTNFLKNTELEINKGILVNAELATSIKDVYAIGDCAEHRRPSGERRSVEQVWYTGRIMGETLAQTITGAPTKYTPGHWFNSAKFFDLEYQTYGWVHNTLRENQDEFIFENDKILIHFVFNKESEQFIGVNAFGIRLRHEIFDFWLNKEASMDDVIQQLQSSFFDPEFFKNYYPSILKEYNTVRNKNIQGLKKSWWRNLIKA